MRDLVIAIGGPLWAERINIKGFLRDVAQMAKVRKAKISHWHIHAAWYGLLREPDNHPAVWKMQQLVKQQQREDADAREELATIKARLSILESRLAAQEANGDREIDHGAHSEVHRPG